MASEVTFDLGNEVRDLGYLCSSAYFIILSLKRLLFPERKETKMTCRPACSYLAAGKNILRVMHPRTVSRGNSVNVNARACFNRHRPTFRDEILKPCSSLQKMGEGWPQLSHYGNFQLLATAAAISKSKGTGRACLRKFSGRRAIICPSILQNRRRKLYSSTQNRYPTPQ